MKEAAAMDKRKLIGIIKMIIIVCNIIILLVLFSNYF